MTFDSAHVASFLELFDEVAPRIRSFPGCLHLELWRDLRYPNALATWSLWESAAALEAYRSSALFSDTWARTKTWFAAPAEAASYELDRLVGPEEGDVTSRA